MESFDKVQELIKYYKEESEARLPFNIVLIGNKYDLDLDRKVPTLKGKMLAEEYGIPFFEASVKNDINIDDVFFSITAEAIKSAKYIDDEYCESVTKLQYNISKQKKRSRCC